MLKNILKLNGVQQLSKKEQKSVNGGDCYPFEACGEGFEWSFFQCGCVK